MKLAWIEGRIRAISPAAIPFLGVALDSLMANLPKREIVEYLIARSLRLARDHGMSEAEIAEILRAATVADHPD